ncbi:Ras and EF-hand domain-containing protein [Stylophora pistillata]|uniref:Ras and EF-hand domain-containing protein n=1 Tax=Stylophora pistillata TaxID=50429 RepID=A0A2B4S711_STYPI|nr:Ras and EF-hand domain-containing protein [Stylophora pistillata]
MADLEDVIPRDLFGTVDLDGSGYIDREELAAVCDLDAHDLAEVFDRLDADKDGRISIEEFSENFKKFKSVVTGVKRRKSDRSSSVDVDYEDLTDRLGEQFSLLSGQEYVSDLFHCLHNSSESPQLIALLESFLFSVVRDVKHYSSENQRLEEALKRTCEKHSEHMDQLDNELEQQMQRLESRIRKEEKSKQERSNLDIVWQLENKNKEIQTLTARVQKLEGKLKRKEPEEQKIKEEVDDKVQEIRYLQSQLTDAQTNLAVLRSELAQLRNDYEEQESQLTAEKRTVLECVQEQESLTRQLQLLHEANKKLHDTNDDLRAALETRKNSDKLSPSPSKRHSISTFYSPTSSMTWKDNKSPSQSRCSSGFGDCGVDSLDGKPAQTTPSRNVASSLPNSSSNSRRGSTALLPSQQSCEVDDDSLAGESSLMTELMQVQQLTVPEDITEEETKSTQRLDYNNNAGILNSRETGQVHHLLPPARQSCEVDDHVSIEDKSLLDEPVIVGYCSMDKTHKTTDNARLTSDLDSEQSDVSKDTDKKDTDKLLRNRNSSRFGSRFGKYFGKLSKNTRNKENGRPSEELKDNFLRKRDAKDNIGKKDDKSPGQSDFKDSSLKKNDNRKGKSYSKKRPDGRTSKPQDKPVSIVKESIKGRNVVDAQKRLMATGHNSDSEDKRENFIRGTKENRNSSKGGGGTYNRLRRNASVTFSPTVTCTTDTARKSTSIITSKKMPPTLDLRLRHFAASETSDTDSTTTQDTETNFHRDVEDEDEAYNSLRSSERKSFSKQLDILQETNKRLCESNDDLRAALEALTGRRSSKLSKARRNGEKCHRNPSIHSDYGSISSRSITPNHLQGPKSEDDVADGAEAEEPGELSGYEPESDVNTVTVNARHFEEAPKLSKLTATPHEFHVALKEHTSDVMWESDPETDPVPAQPTHHQHEHQQQQHLAANVETNASNLTHSPFVRNSLSRKPCRHKSLEQLFNHSNSKGDRSAWPPIARAGKWNSMEQVRRRNDFIGERTRSLPTSRWQSDEKVNLGQGIGLWQLSEKLNVLRASRESVAELKDDFKVNVIAASHEPVIQSFNTENRTIFQEDLGQLVRKPSLRQRIFHDKKITEKPVPEDKSTPTPVDFAEGSNLRRRNSLVIKRNRTKTDSLPESDNSKPDTFSAELEAQFKSVIEEDDEDIDEDDVGDEELAQLVAMARANTESEDDSETEAEAPEEERVPAVGSDSLSEASSNTPLHASVAEINVPERMYKLVLAGDAAVGKSSFILRLCRNRFHSALNSTLGVDFQMKTLVVDDKTIAFQLWDTAGQERFRSIAKSYFRKADGVLLLYDVTCETSFINVRDWVEAIEDSTSKPIPIMLCGNKTDLRQSYIAEGKTVITEENGEKLAREYGALFIETSSKENRNITDACIELGRLLRKIEDTEVEQSHGVTLKEGDEKSKKESCCLT